MWKLGRDVLCMRRHIRVRLIVLMDRRLCRNFAPCPRCPSTCGGSWPESPFPANTVLAVISYGLYIFTDSTPEHPHAQTTSGEMMPTTKVDVERLNAKLQATDSRCVPAEVF